MQRCKGIILWKGVGWGEGVGVVCKSLANSIAIHGLDSLFQNMHDFVFLLQKCLQYFYNSSKEDLSLFNLRISHHYSPIIAINIGVISSHKAVLPSYLSDCLCLLCCTGIAS